MHSEKYPAIRVDCNIANGLWIRENHLDRLAVQAWHRRQVRVRVSTAMPYPKHDDNENKYACQEQQNLLHISQTRSAIGQLSSISAAAAPPAKICERRSMGTGPK